MEEPLLSCSLVWQVASVSQAIYLSSEQGGHLSPGAQSKNKGTQQCLTHVGTHTLSLLPYPVGDAHGCCRSTWMPGAWAHRSPSWRLLPPPRAARLASEPRSLSCRAGPARPSPRRHEPELELSRQCTPDAEGPSRCGGSCGNPGAWWALGPGSSLACVHILAPSRPASL